MLTTDLLRFRMKDGKVVLRYLDKKAKKRLEDGASAMIEVFRGGVGLRRETLEQALDAIPFEPKDRVVALGLRKLCEDRASFEATSTMDPRALRGDLFAAAAAAHRLGAFDRARIIADVAAARSTSAEAIDTALFADLRSNEALVTFEPLSVEALLGSYDLSLAQAVLLQATRVSVRIEKPTAAVLRDIVRSLRFHGLLCAVEEKGNHVEIDIDGPFSLFDAVKKYGLRLAMFLPHVSSLPRFWLTADVVLGPRKIRAVFELTHDDPPCGSGPIAPPPQRAEITAIKKAWRDLDSPWKLSTEAKLVRFGAEVVVADLSFTHASGTNVLCELFGFWSRAAVFRRVEQLAVAPERMLLLVQKSMRVSEEIVEDDEDSAIVVYRTAPNAKRIQEALDKILAASGRRRSVRS